MMPDDTFAARLAAARKSLGLTQTDMTEILGVTPGYIGQLESGHRVPTLDRMYTIAVALGIDPHTLDDRLASAQRRR